MVKGSAAPDTLHRAILGESTLTFGELLGFVVFFLIIGFSVFGKYSVWIGLILLFVAVCMY